MMTVWLAIFWLAFAVLLYTQIGYPVLMFCLASILAGRNCCIKNEQSELPTLSLIIPAHNEESVIAAKLDNACVLDYPECQLEIIVASDGSDDKTVEIARHYESRGIRLLAFQERRGKTSILNDAVAAARGEVICLCDANVMFQRDALRRLVDRLADPGIGAVSGDVRLASHESNFGEGESLYYRVERAIQVGESCVGSIMDVDGGMYVVRKELFQPLPEDAILDDSVMTMRVIQQGKRVVYEPTAIATENGTPTATVEFWRRVRMTAGAVQLLKRGEWLRYVRPTEFWQFVSHRLLRWAGPLWLALLFLSNLALWHVGVFYRLVLSGQLLVFGLAAVATLWLRFRETRIGGITFYFVVSHIAMALGLMVGMLNRQRVTWNRTQRTVESSRDAGKVSC